MKPWEIIADNLHDAGWSLGWVSALDLEGRTIWIADAHRDDRKRFVVRWQAGRSRLVEIQCNGHWQFDEVFELIAFVSTFGELTDRLAALC